ncbi:tripartite tricarboxylate transporter substrate binding protein BugD [Roseomonas sp. SSH11]|uniref:Tripartite tricarboxylate transporter substrate binding protein BugD n=1 Tax=Pararoseomonas baculiformis TaxID=2820812 RepID=A0ABS4AH24_9PROT|nr:tripartite tricarboxylate transporter substrate-binding protein [Pararoseomonas baculiformis]MBP0446164.1 tripartite tricarboxylate transporter substrate binding protein BugD [Pararoseomonas baculiformis]
MTQITRRLLAATSLAALGLPRQAGAQSSAFPTRPITMVIPFAAGGPTDVVGRLLAEAMSRDLGQPVVVENTTGAGGTLGAQRVATARPDGYTILLHHIGMGVIPTMYRRLAYDPVNGFEPLGLVTEVPMTVVTRKDIPANNLTELLSYMKSQGDRFNLADAGIGSSSALCGALLSNAIGVKPTVIPFRGTGPAMQEILGGRVDLLCDQTTQTTEHIRSGAVKVFATPSRTRIGTLPEIPTTAEAGLPGFEVTVWHGLYAPKGTPAPICARLTQSLQAALREPRVIERFSAIGTTPVSQDDATAEAHRRFWTADIAKWKPVIEATGSYAD